MSSSSFQLKSKVVCAGAGTGKTTHLVDEVIQAYKSFESKKQKPYLIVCTFTIKATQELKERFYEKAKEQSDSGFLNYIQSSCFRISSIDSILSSFLRDYSYEYGLNPDFTLEDSQQINKLFNELSEDYFFEKHSHLLKKIKFNDLQEALKFYIEKKLAYGNIDLLNESDFLKNLDPKKKDKDEYQAENFLPLFKDFKLMADEFFVEYIEKKKTQGCLEMKDLGLFSLDLLRKKPQVAAAYFKEWDYWFIDEYQDTSWIQEQILKSFTNDFKNVFCVGDPQQSIYFFRGADPNVFQRRKDALSGEIQNLNTNYRSQASLIHFFNDIFKKEKGFIKFQPPKGKICDAKKPCVQILTYNKDKEQFFAALYGYIHQLLDEGSKLSDITILSRKNSDLYQVSSFLKKKKMNFVLHGSSRFFNNRLILDALFLFKFLINPHDHLNLSSLLRTPYFYFTDQKIMDKSYEYNKEKRRLSFWSYLLEKQGQESVIQDLKNYLEIQKDQGLLKTFEQALLERSYFDTAYYQDSSGVSEANLWKLLSLLKTSLKPLDVFYSFLEEENSKEDSSRDQEAVSALDSKDLQLMTIHKSKGLQFKHVILCDFSLGKPNPPNDNHCNFDIENKKMAFSIPVGNRYMKKIKSFPQKEMIEDKKQKEKEELDRLYYVAMTRAQDSLALAIPSHKDMKNNSWLIQNSFFQSLETISNSESDSKKTKEWKEGIYSRDQYCFSIKHDFKYDFKKKPSQDKVKPVPLYKPQDISKSYIKSSQDFSNSYQNFVKDLKPTSVSVRPIENKISKMNLGIHLHHYLRLLSGHSLEDVSSFLNQAHLSQDKKENIKKGLDFILELKDPNFSYFLKQGYSEWDFKFRKNNVTLQGRIDLWGLKDKEIWLFDYKSSFSESTKKQLIFYSWVLKKMYQIETIYMCEVYPFEKKIKKYSYNDKDQKEIETWLKTLV